MKKFCLLALVVAAALSLPAFADSTLYSNYSNWAAHSTALTTANLNGLVSAGSYSSMGQAFSTNGVSFSSPNAGLYIVDPQFNPGSYTNWGTGLALLQVNWGTLNIGFGSSTSASLYLNAIPGYGTTFTVSFLNGGSELDSYQISTAGYPTATFVGYTSSNSFDSIRIVPNGGYTLVSGVTYGQDPPPVNLDVIATPEPASLLLLASGLTAVGWRKRKNF